MEITLVIIFFALFGTEIFASSRKRRRKNILPDVKYTPILLAYYSQGSTIVPVKEWKIKNMHVQSFVFLQFKANSKDILESAGMVRVELPFRTKIHLLGIPKDSGEVRLKPIARNSAMERVELEGDYPNYFDLFADKQQQAESRYHFDPTAMAFTVDFCRSHSWEIIEDELYFLQSSQNHPDDPTLMLDDIAAFVEEIRPAIEIKNSKLQNKLRTPYGKERRSFLECPICQSEMPYVGAYFACPAKHGLLISAPNLVRFRKKEIQFNDSQKVKHSTHDISCPSCSKIMKKVQYAGGSTIIDSCPNCPYRWLDHGEISL